MMSLSVLQSALWLCVVPNCLHGSCHLDGCLFLSSSLHCGYVSSPTAYMAPVTWTDVSFCPPVCTVAMCRPQLPTWLLSPGRMSLSVLQSSLWLCVVPNCLHGSCHLDGCLFLSSSLQCGYVSSPTAYMAPVTWTDVSFCPPVCTVAMCRRQLPTWLLSPGRMSLSVLQSALWLCVVPNCLHGSCHLDGCPFLSSSLHCGYVSSPTAYMAPVTWTDVSFCPPVCTVAMCRPQLPTWLLSPGRMSLSVLQSALWLCVVPNCLHGSCHLDGCPFLSSTVCTVAMCRPQLPTWLLSPGRMSLSVLQSALWLCVVPNCLHGSCHLDACLFLSSSLHCGYVSSPTAYMAPVTWTDVSFCPPVCTVAMCRPQLPTWLLSPGRMSLSVLQSSLWLCVVPNCLHGSWHLDGCPFLSSSLHCGYVSSPTAYMAPVTWTDVSFCPPVFTVAMCRPQLPTWLLSPGRMSLSVLQSAMWLCVVPNCLHGSCHLDGCPFLSSSLHCGYVSSPTAYMAPVTWTDVSFCPPVCTVAMCRPQLPTWLLSPGRMSLSVLQSARWLCVVPNCLHGSCHLDGCLFLSSSLHCGYVSSPTAYMAPVTWTDVSFCPPVCTVAMCRPQLPTWLLSPGRMSLSVLQSSLWLCVVPNCLHGSCHLDGCPFLSSSLHCGYVSSPTAYMAPVTWTDVSFCPPVCTVAMCRPQLPTWLLSPGRMSIWLNWEKTKTHRTTTLSSSKQVHHNIVRKFCNPQLNCYAVSTIDLYLDWTGQSHCNPRLYVCHVECQATKPC